MDWRLIYSSQEEEAAGPPKAHFEAIQVLLFYSHEWFHSSSSFDLMMISTATTSYERVGGDR